MRKERTKEYKILLKDKWEDITIEDYYNIKDVDNNVHLITQLSNLSYDEVKTLPMKVLQTLVEGLDFLNADSEAINDSPTSLFAFEDSESVSHYYKLNVDIPNWESGRFMEVMELSKDSESIEENLPLLLAIMCDKYIVTKSLIFRNDTLEEIPRKERELMKEGEIILKNCSYGQASLVVSFFLSLLQPSSKSTVDYSELGMTSLTNLKGMMNMTKVLHSSKIGSGTFSRKEWQKLRE